MKIGVFALQGSFIEHIKMLKKLGVETVEVRTVKDTEDIDGALIPGGESTTMMQLLEKTGLDEWIVNTDIPLYGTCAGMIVLSRGYLNKIDVEVDRNAYGSQQESFEDTIRVNGKPFHGVFIRAPKFKHIGEAVTILAKHLDEPVLAQQENVMVGSFHPELTDNPAVHEHFLHLIK